MVSKKNNFVIAAMFAIVAFLMVSDISSCRKPGPNGTLCRNMTCYNGGYCNHLGDTCSCPTGFEGATCATADVTKYLGTWTLKQTIIGSDSFYYIGRDTIYNTQLKTTATPTTFFISNFNNNSYYNDIICTMDSLNSSNFRIDTISAFQMIYYNYQILSGNGYIAPGHDSIYATFRTRHRNTSTNWEVDTLNVVMTLQHR